MAQIWGYVAHSGTVVSGMHAILKGQILHTNSGKFKTGFSYSFNSIGEHTIHITFHAAPYQSVNCWVNFHIGQELVIALAA